jgi:hypothetical protein
MFPIIHADHFYVIALNVKTLKFHILDNSEVDVDLELKYGKIPEYMVSVYIVHLVFSYYGKCAYILFMFFLQREVFVQFLIQLKMFSKAEAFKDSKKVPVERLEMHWRNSENVTDCGIYAMRHMETYMGNGLHDWNPELKREESKKQMLILRMRYWCALLTSDLNEQKSFVEENIKVAQAKKKAVVMKRTKGLC